MDNNKCINKFMFREMSTPSRNCALKVKTSSNITILNHEHTYEDDFVTRMQSLGYDPFDYPSYHISQEHLLSAHVKSMSNLVMDNCTVEVIALPTSRRNGYSAENVEVRNSKFGVKKAGGILDLIRISDSSKKGKSISISKNTINAPGATVYGVDSTINTLNTEKNSISIVDNTINAENTNLLGLGTTGATTGGSSVSSVAIRNNKGPNIQEINRYALPPLIGSLEISSKSISSFGISPQTAVVTGDVSIEQSGSLMPGAACHLMTLDRTQVSSTGSYVFSITSTSSSGVFSTTFPVTVVELTGQKGIAVTTRTGTAITLNTGIGRADTELIGSTDQVTIFGSSGVLGTAQVAIKLVSLISAHVEIKVYKLK